MVGSGQYCVRQNLRLESAPIVALADPSPEDERQENMVGPSPPPSPTQLTS